MTAFNNGQIIFIEKSGIVNTPRVNELALFNLNGKLIGKDGFGNVLDYVIGESLVAISGSLQNQIDNINSITLVAGNNISIIENPANTFTISGGGSNDNLNLYTLLTTTSAISGNLQEQINTIIQEGITIASSGGSIFVSQNGTAFNLEVASAPISNHNSLLGLQGGISGQYYHLTATQYASITGGISGSSNLSTLGDVTLSNPLNNDVLVYNGSKWINSDTVPYTSNAGTASHVSNAGVDITVSGGGIVFSGYGDTLTFNSSGSGIHSTNLGDVAWKSDITSLSGSLNNYATKATPVAGTYNTITINSQGIVTSGSNVAGGSSSYTIGTYNTSGSNIITTDVALCDSSSDSSFTVTLPTAVGVNDKIYKIKKIDGGIIRVRVLTTLSQTIDGEPYYDITNKNDFISCMSDGSNWRIF